MSTTRARRRRRGFILLFGTRTIISNDAAAPSVRAVCPRCNREVDILAKRYRTWFTIFFLPVFPISGSKPFSQCSNCAAQFPVTADQLRTRLNVNEQAQSREAIGLYNSLRSSPANSITLNQLMTLYASLKEFDQALSAASDFPQALHASEQCMTTLARVYMSKGEFEKADQWFDAAITRNSQLGEAHYYKAAANLLRNPPDLAKAVASARAARNAGFPNADALLREAEEKARAAQA